MPANPAEIIARYERAVARTHELIEPAVSHTLSRTALQHRAAAKLERLRVFLANIGNPHLAAPVIHVAGTSGKGSTATFIAEILRAAGLRAGLYTSPYLQVATEKLQIANRLIPAGRFAAQVDALFDAIAGTGYPPLSYGEFWMALVASTFAASRVDVAVIETGAGGRFDMTNVVQPRICVITSIGLDHVETLGPTIEQIAWHKAGIFKPGAHAVTAVKDPTALAVLKAESERVNCPLLPFDPTAIPGYDPRKMGLQMAGSFQATNAALAASACRLFLGERLTVQASITGLHRARLPGRVETVQTKPTVILDGAHNAEKIAALAADLPRLARRRPGARLIVVAGVLAAKDHAEIVRTLTPHADVLILTAPSVDTKPAADPAVLAAEASAAGFTGEIAIEPDPRRAVKRALALANRDDVVLVTGSLYLAGNVRGLWYPDRSVLLQATPWPVSRRG